MRAYFQVLREQENDLITGILTKEHGAESDDLEEMEKSLLDVNEIWSTWKYWERKEQKIEWCYGACFSEMVTTKGKIKQHWKCVSEPMYPIVGIFICMDN